MRRPFTFILGLAGAALVLAPAALAAPPSNVTVTQSGGMASVRWTLPAGGQALVVEIADATAVDADGYFLTDDVVDTEVFIDGSTSWSSDEQLDPGTYYVHVAGWDKSCTTCKVPEWSTVKSFTVPGATTSPGSTGSGGSTSPGDTGATAPSAPATGPETTPSTGPQTSPSAPEAPAVPSTPPVSSVPSAPVAADSVGLVAARLRGGLALVVFRACGSGTVSVNVAVARGKGSHLAEVTLPVSGCTTYALGLSVPAGAGRATVSLGTGGTTGAVVKQL